MWEYKGYYIYCCFIKLQNIESCDLQVSIDLQTNNYQQQHYEFCLFCDEYQIHLVNQYKTLKLEKYKEVAGKVGLLWEAVKLLQNVLLKRETKREKQVCKSQAL